MIGIYGNAGRLIDSLNFVTNKRDTLASFGRWGGTGGHPFSLYVPPGFKIRKFFGSSGAALDSIGIIAEKEPSLQGRTGEPLYKLGAAGGWGGNDFGDQAIADPTIRVGNILVNGKEGCINFIQFEYVDANGLIVAKTGPYGANRVCPGRSITGGYPAERISLEAGEFVTGIRGRAGTVVDQLSFVTNRRVIGPFGGDEGRPFWLEAPPGYQVRRLFGRSGALLDAVGVIAELMLGQ